MSTQGHQNQTRAIKAHLERMERNLHTATPGIVVSYDASSQTADVRPAIRRALPTATDEDIDTYEDLPVCPHVPVAWPQGQGFSIVGTLSPGDSVLLVFCERDFSDFYENGGVSNPQFAELHALNGAIAIPTCLTRAKPAAPATAAVTAAVLRAELVKIKAALDTIAAAVPVSHSYVVPAASALESTILKLGG